MEKISIVGLDGSGKDSAIELMVKKHLSPSYSHNVDYVPVQLATDHIPVGRRVASHFEDGSPLSALPLSRFMAAAAYVFFIGLAYGFNQQRVISKHVPDVLVASRDPLIDGPVYWQAYGLFSNISLQSAMGLLRLLGNRPPKRLVYLKVEPRIALERLNNAYDNQKKKVRQHHENLRDFSIILAAYKVVLDILTAMNVPVAEIDTSRASLDEVADELFLQIRPHLLPSGEGQPPQKVLVVK